MTACENCGQQCMEDYGWAVRGWCPDCRAGQYGASEQHCQPGLFVVPPPPIPGQEEMPV